ncbi:hypothetical protein ACFQT0_21250 [Hymenobacter humi]|uniref:Uncharacterized protein n=1 Tax=Hymenobacter humi TaxID=1411620 RepID=A0ABW2U949_9BACT
MHDAHGGPHQEGPHEEPQQQKHAQRERHQQQDAVRKPKKERKKRGFYNGGGGGIPVQAVRFEVHICAVLDGVVQPGHRLGEKSDGIHGCNSLWVRNAARNRNALKMRKGALRLPQPKQKRKKRSCTTYRSRR